MIVLLILFALWVFFIWASVSVAQNKGRSAVLGFVLGAGLGIFGLVLMWLVPANQQVIWEREAAFREQRERRRADIAGDGDVLCSSCKRTHRVPWIPVGETVPACPWCRATLV